MSTTATKLLGSNTGPAVGVAAPAFEPHIAMIPITAIAAPADPVSTFLNIGILLSVGEELAQVVGGARVVDSPERPRILDRSQQGIVRVADRGSEARLDDR